MKIIVSSASLRRYLVKESKSGSPTAILIAQIFLFATSLCLKETSITKHEAGRIIIALAYHISALVLPFLRLLMSIFTFLRKDCGFKVYYFSNCICLLLSIIFESFYEKTLAGLCVAFCLAVLLLLVLIIIRPRNDFGFVCFFIGAAATISPVLYKLGYKTWVVVAICFVLIGVTGWLNQNWLDVDVNEENQAITLGISKSVVQVLLASEAVIVVVFFLYWDQYLFRTGTDSSKSSLVVGVCLGMLFLWFILAIIRHVTPRLRFYSESPDGEKDIENNEGEKVYDDKGKGKIEDIDEGNIEVIIDEVIIPKKIRPTSRTDTLKQRKVKPSKPESFSKIVSDTDINKQLEIPSEFIKHLPESHMGGTDYSRQVQESWTEFCHKNNVKVGDRIYFYAEDGGSYFFRHESRKPPAEKPPTKKGTFTKTLSDTDIKKHLEVPSEFIEYLPVSNMGGTVYIPVLDESSERVRFFGYYIMKEAGYPKPVFQEGWTEFCHKKDLKVGDRIAFHADGGGSYRIGLINRKPNTSNL